MSPFNAKSLLEYWPTMKYQKKKYIYIYIYIIYNLFTSGFFCGELNSPFGNQKEKMALQGVQRVFFFFFWEKGKKA